MHTNTHIQQKNNLKKYITQKLGHIYTPSINDGSADFCLLFFWRTAISWHTTKKTMLGPNTTFGHSSVILVLI